eukprot:evm.model.NODE_10460_length_6450_cov_19.326511.1
MKFGGSSLANAERVDYVAKLIKSQIEKGFRPTVVCSAMGKTTNNLLNAGHFALEGNVYVDSLRTLHLTTAQELGMGNDTIALIEELLDELKNLLNGVSYLRELTPRTLDYLVSFGERLSVRIMAARLNQLGVPAQHFESWNLGLRTTSDFGKAEILPECYDTIKTAMKKLDGSMVAVVTGFIGHDPEGRITTLGRGGSDLTASTLGAAVPVDEIQVWKDVNGIMTANPKVVSNAVPVPFVSFEEASELAYFGAEILHPISMVPAMRFNIPVRVKNSYNPDHPGTVIWDDKDKTQLVTAITSKRHVDLVDIVSTWMLGQYGFLSRVFTIFEEQKISVDCVATSEVSISLTLDAKKHDDDAEDRLVKALSDVAAVTVHPNRAIVSLIANVARSSEVLSIVFDALKEAGIQVEMLSQGASKVNISLIVKDEDAERCTQILHDRFFYPNGVHPAKTQ